MTLCSIDKPGIFNWLEIYFNYKTIQIIKVYFRLIIKKQLLIIPKHASN